jgi:hypothetical protein
MPLGLASNMPLDFALRCGKDDLVNIGSLENLGCLMILKHKGFDVEY